MRILSGVQSSGKLHLGNYFGAIRQFVDLQDSGESLYFIANLHSLTTVREGDRQRALTREAAMAFLALGLDPALMSSIFLTTFTDIFGFLILLGLGTFFLARLLGG